MPQVSGSEKSRDTSTSNRTESINPRYPLEALRIERTEMNIEEFSKLLGLSLEDYEYLVKNNLHPCPDWFPEEGLAPIYDDQPEKKGAD